MRISCFFLSILLIIKVGNLHCEWEGKDEIADGPEQKSRVVGLSGMGVSSMWRAAFLAVGKS